MLGSKGFVNRSLYKLTASTAMSGGGPPLGGDARSKRAGDLAAWAGNVSTSVLIVFVNKVVMKSIGRGGFGFHYGERPNLERHAHARALPHRPRPLRRAAPALTFLRTAPLHAATTLTAFHFLVCSLSIWVTQGLGFIKKTKMPGRGAAARGHSAARTGGAGRGVWALPACWAARG